MDDKLAALREAVAHEPGNAAYLADLGRELLARGRLTEADSTFMQLASLDPDAAEHDAADLGQNIFLAYDAAISDYVVSLANDRASYRTRLEQQRIDWSFYIECVKKLANEQVPDLRVPYRNWSKAQSEEDAARKRYSSLVRRSLLWFTSTAVSLAGNVAFIDTGLVAVGTVFSLVFLISFVFSVRYGIKMVRARRQLGQLKKISPVAVDKLTTLVINLILEPAITASLQIIWSDSQTDRVRILDGAELSAKAQVNNLVSTAANNRLAIALSRSHGAAVGIAGPRGSGKTELARAFTELRPNEPESTVIPLMLWAPVNYDPQTFLLRLLKELCIGVSSLSSGVRGGRDPSFRAKRERRLRNVILVSASLIGIGITTIVIDLTGISLRTVGPLAAGSALILAGGIILLSELPSYETIRRSPRASGIRQSTLDFATELRSRVEFTETYTRGTQMGISGHGLSAAATEGTQLSRIPLNEVDVVRELRNLVGLVADAGRQVVIAIDELDKMSGDKEATKFLNHLKVLFPIHDCSFIISVSENAWALFENRGLPFRDVFDSSFDEIVRMEMLRPEESRNLLKRRSANVTDTQALLCHCISGGLPRDLLRAVRRMARVANQLQKTGAAGPPHLCDVLDILLAEELDDKVAAAEFWMSKDQPGDKSEAPAELLASRAEAWRDQGETERWLRNCRYPATDDAFVERPEFEVYFAVLHTIRQAFAPGGPLIKLERESGFDNAFIVNGFDLLARARRRLSTHVPDAWKLLDSARETLGLPPLTMPRDKPAQERPDLAHDHGVSAGSLR
jgi:energy-coupling factor transporter ATP-binding protein EcfA2/tetratricopeptide (TPR) repeat protein